MARKNSKGGSLLVLLTGGIIWLLSSIPKEGWIIVGLITVVAIIAVRSSKRSVNKTTGTPLGAEPIKTVAEAAKPSIKNLPTRSRPARKVVSLASAPPFRVEKVNKIGEAPADASLCRTGEPMVAQSLAAPSVIPTTTDNSIKPAPDKIMDPVAGATQSIIDPRTGIPKKEAEEDFVAVQQELTQALSLLLKERIRISVRVPGSTGAEIPVQVQPNRADVEYRLPQRSKALTADAIWVPPGGTFELGGQTIKGGMVYIGTSLPAAYGSPDPCLIDKSQSLGPSVPLSIRSMSYWPSYSNITPSDRATYLDWLAGGRSDPRADVGFVFLFFYGLERRVLIDAKTDPQAKEELPAIAHEIDRLLSIYGSSHSFDGYATTLLDLIRMEQGAERLYERPIPQLRTSYELPMYLKMAIGQASRDGVPLSADLALEWLHREPTVFLRTPAQRCPGEFKEHFLESYRSKYGNGLKLPKNRTRLKLTYRPASAGFRQQSDISKTFTDLSDVTAVTGPLEELRELAIQVTDDLDAYSRFMGRSPELKDKAVHLLPFSLWPGKAKSGVLQLKERVMNGLVDHTVRGIFDELGVPTEGTKAELLSLYRVLDAVGIALEPEIGNGAKLPKLDEHLVFFAKPDGTSSASLAYRTAQLTLQLAATMVHADGEFSEHERDYLLAQIASWKDLTPAERARLRAHMHLVALEPMTFAALKKKLEPLSMESRERLAEFMATLARMDGVVSSDEVKVLEKAYKALGLDAGRVFSDLHATATTGRSTSQDRTKGVRLDPARVAALQKDSEKVSQLLASIFTEEEHVRAEVTDKPEEAEPAPNDGRLLGLDRQHTALAHLLLSRPIWNRMDLADAAADMDMMLDGALERINEVAFDAYDIPFFEGEDPLEINPELVEKLSK